MVPLQKNIAEISRMLEDINPSNLPIGELQKDGNYLLFLEHCLQTNEIIAIDFQQVNEQVFCFPIVEPSAFTQSVRETIWNQTLLNAAPNFKHRVHVEFKLRQYWKIEDFKYLEELEQLTNPRDILHKALTVAKRVLQRSPHELGMVCGPISTGTKSVEENLRIFNRTVHKLSLTMSVFNQLPFESLFAHVHELLKRPEYQHFLKEGSSSIFFIEEFYRVLFAMNKAWRPHFIYGWENSTGAREERNIFKVLKSTIIDLEEGFDNL